MKAIVNVGGLNVRDGAGLAHKRIGLLIRNQEIKVLEGTAVLSDGYQWVQVIDPVAGFVAVKKEGTEDNLIIFLEEDNDFMAVVWPSQSKWITQRYGDNYKYYFDSFGLPGHEGVDIGASEGSPIFAISSGIVKMAYKENDMLKKFHNYGQHVRVTHPGGYESIYAHLSKVLVVSGQDIPAGMMIGLAGNTGNSTGTHLHLSVKKAGKFIDPLTIFTGI